MTIYSIDVRPGGSPVFSVGAVLDGLEVRFSLRWLPFVGLWTCTLKSPAGVDLSMPLMVQPGGLIRADVRDPRVPPGSLLWLGPDGYGRDDLGETLRLVYVSA
jgi:hypothetical protein